MNGRTLVIASAIAVVATVVVMAQWAAPQQAAVDAYRAAIRSTATGRAPRAIEAAFSALGVMREALTRTQSGQNMSPLEALPEKQFQALKQELPGAIVNRDEIVFVEPDLDYFARLAARNGDAADRAFFAGLKSTYPESVWPVYIEQQTDYSGCTRFGGMSLVETYRLWSDFQRRFSGRYAAGAAKEIDGVLERLTASTCACRDLASAEQELQRFLRDFPASPARAAVDRRLQAIRDGRSDIRPSCISG
jgi:hypothetical protein